jgi:hypothetical protein
MRMAMLNRIRYEMAAVAPVGKEAVVSRSGTAASSSTAGAANHKKTGALNPISQ